MMSRAVPGVNRRHPSNRFGWIENGGFVCCKEEKIVVFMHVQETAGKVHEQEQTEALGQEHEFSYDTNRPLPPPQPFPSSSTTPHRYPFSDRVTLLGFMFELTQFLFAFISRSSAVGLFSV